MKVFKSVKFLSDIKNNTKKINNLHEELFPKGSYWSGIHRSLLWGTKAEEQKSEIKVLHNSIDELRKEIDKLHTYLKVVPATTNERHYLKKVTPKRKAK